MMVAKENVTEGWVIEYLRGSAGEIHGALIPDPPVASVWVCEPTRTALVLGSTQARTFDREAWSVAGVDLVVRNSGGGAVLLIPDACTWIDLVLPAGHHLWDDDIGRAAHWVGELWARALSWFDIEAQVHTGALQSSRWSSLVCFAGVGPGEVLDHTGAKLVGVSQRRTRSAARFQTVAYHRPAPDVGTLLGLGDRERNDLASYLAATTALVEVERSALIAALTAELPQP